MKKELKAEFDHQFDHALNYEKEQKWKEAANIRKLSACTDNGLGQQIGKTEQQLNDLQIIN